MLRGSSLALLPALALASEAAPPPPPPMTPTLFCPLSGATNYGARSTRAMQKPAEPTALRS